MGGTKKLNADKALVIAHVEASPKNAFMAPTIGSGRKERNIVVPDSHLGDFKVGHVRKIRKVRKVRKFRH